MDSRLGAPLAAVLATKLVYATSRIHDLLLAGVKGVTSRADFNVKVLAQSGTGRKLVPATA